MTRRRRPFDLPRFERQPGLATTTKGWEYFAPISWFEEMPYLYLMQMSYPTYYATKAQNLISAGVGVHASFDDVFLI